MKRQIRNNVFETNSSSMHSLVVMKKNERYTKEEIAKDFSYLSNDKNTGEKHCVWNIWNEDELYFGRSPFKILYNFKNKWIYAMASLVLEYNDEIYKELKRIAIKNVPGLKKIKLPTTQFSIMDKEDEKNINSDYAKKYGKTEDEFIKYLSEKKKQFELTEEIFYWKDEYGDFVYEAPYTGIVDENILIRFLEKENITLEEFLLNKKYVIVVDGDEYCIWKDFKNTGLIDLGMIEREYPKEEY